MSMLEFVEHALYGFVIMRERFTHAFWQSSVVDEVPEALTSQRQVVAFLVLLLAVSLRPLFLPGPFWQRGERPLQYAH